MIELNDDRLVFTFPEVHAEAKLSIDFQRTLRIPDDGKTYALPPGLGPFPLCHVDDHAERVPASWMKRGGVMLPMFQSEALWIFFRGGYPFAVKIAAGKINAVTGETWSPELVREPQDYVVPPNQPWVDGYCVEKGTIRQFVAMPLGAGYTAEEQLTGEAEHGGLQLLVHPLKREAYERLSSRVTRQDSITLGFETSLLRAAVPDMGLAPGGRMKQEIYDDLHALEDWDLEHSSRCFVHIANSMVWQAITGVSPPTPPPTAKQYTASGLPWFDYYGGDLEALVGSKKLAGLDSIKIHGEKMGDVPLPENESVAGEKVVNLGASKTKDQVREGPF